MQVDLYNGCKLDSWLVGLNEQRCDTVMCMVCPYALSLCSFLCFCQFSSTCLCILHCADTWQITFWKQISGTSEDGTEIAQYFTNRA